MNEVFPKVGGDALESIKVNLMKSRLVYVVHYKG